MYKCHSVIPAPYQVRGKLQEGSIFSTTPGFRACMQAYQVGNGVFRESYTPGHYERSVVIWWGWTETRTTYQLLLKFTPSFSRRYILPRLPRRPSLCEGLLAKTGGEKLLRRQVFIGTPRKDRGERLLRRQVFIGTLRKDGVVEIASPPDFVGMVSQ